MVIINHFVSLFWTISSFHHYSYLINGFRAAVFFFVFFPFSFFLLIFLFWLSFVYFFRPIGMKNDFKIAENLGQNGTNKNRVVLDIGQWIPPIFIVVVVVITFIFNKFTDLSQWPQKRSEKKEEKWQNSMEIITVAFTNHNW